MGWKFHFAAANRSDIYRACRCIGADNLYQIEYIVRCIPFIYSVGIHCSACGFYDRSTKGRIY